MKALRALISVGLAENAGALALLASRAKARPLYNGRAEARPYNSPALLRIIRTRMVTGGLGLFRELEHRLALLRLDPRRRFRLI